jgi:hypothetical protein
MVVFLEKDIRTNVFKCEYVNRFIHYNNKFEYCMGYCSR